MEQYIPKSVLVAELNKLKNISLEYGYTTEQRIVADVGKDLTLKGLLDYIDTIEVKEVELKEYYHEFLQKEWFDNKHVRTVSEMMAFTAKHFFELGLKTQKGK